MSLNVNPDQSKMHQIQPVVLKGELGNPTVAKLVSNRACFSHHDNNQYEMANNNKLSKQDKTGIRRRFFFLLVHPTFQHRLPKPVLHFEHKCAFARCKVNNHPCMWLNGFLCSEGLLRGKNPHRQGSRLLLPRAAVRV